MGVFVRNILAWSNRHDKKSSKIIIVYFFLRGCGASVAGKSVAALIRSRCALVTRRFLCLASCQMYIVQLESADKTVLSQCHVPLTMLP
jgi:hypothetical protein